MQGFTIQKGTYSNLEFNFFSLLFYHTGIAIGVMF